MFDHYCTYTSNTEEHSLTCQLEVDTVKERGLGDERGGLMWRSSEEQTKKKSARGGNSWQTCRHSCNCSIAKAMKYNENTHSLNKATSVMGKEGRARSKTEKKSAGDHFRKLICNPPNQTLMHSTMQEL